MTPASFCLPTLWRWERPSGAPFRASNDQPGRLAVGPDEKQGLWGGFWGLFMLEFLLLAAVRTVVAMLAVVTASVKSALNVKICVCLPPVDRQWPCGAVG